MEQNWIGYILQRNCLLKHVIEGKIEKRTDVTGRRGRRSKQLLDDVKGKKRYYKLKGEALDRSMWRIPRSAATVYLCVLCGSQNKQRLFPYTSLTDWFL
jgi:hypothetical protein